MMPGKRVSPARSLTMRLSRTSDLTERRATRPASTSLRSSPSVVALGVIPHLNRRRPFRVFRVFRGYNPSVALVYAHRGGSKLRPENTIMAFDHGLSLGADGLEFDVHLSRDGVVVVHHDATLDRTTNGRGPLAALTADELARLDAGYHFEGHRGRAGGVPRLDEVLRRYPSAQLIVELKVNDPELARRTI